MYRLEQQPSLSNVRPLHNPSGCSDLYRDAARMFLVQNACRSEHN
jgi:hypothetical protein